MQRKMSCLSYKFVHHACLTTNTLFLARHDIFINVICFVTDVNYFVSINAYVSLLSAELFHYQVLLYKKKLMAQQVFIC